MLVYRSVYGDIEFPKNGLDFVGGWKKGEIESKLCRMDLCLMG